MRLPVFAVLAAVLTLAACGADGPPKPPEPRADKSGPYVSGQVKVGIAGGS